MSGERQERTVGDDIDKLNEDGLHNFQWSRAKATITDTAIYGEYNFPQVTVEKKQQMEDALREINVLVTPTIKQLRHTANMQEIQDRIYRKFAFFESELNTCIFASKNIRDTNYCVDKFTDQLRGEGKDYVTKILRDY